MGGGGRGALVVGMALLAAGCGTDTENPARVIPGADAAQGHATIAAVGCGACHVIPGVAGARGSVGPALAGFARRAFIAGQLPNTPEMLVRWVRSAPSLVPATAMPPMPLTEEEARDVAAFLYTLG